MTSIRSRHRQKGIWLRSRFISQNTISVDSANAGGMGRNISRRKKVYNQEYNKRELDCEVYGCKVRTCNWLRHLGTKKHGWG